jgi:hypothetical protein
MVISVETLNCKGCATYGGKSLDYPHDMLFFRQGYESLHLRGFQRSLFTVGIIWPIIGLQIGVSHMQSPQGG